MLNIILILSQSFSTQYKSHGSTTKEDTSVQYAASTKSSPELVLDFQMILIFKYFSTSCTHIISTNLVVDVNGGYFSTT